MSQKIIEYTLDTLTPQNPDASCPAAVTGCALVPGPGPTTLGTYPQALDFGGSGQLISTLPIPKLNTTKFCIRIVFKIDNTVTARQTLTESNALPFSIYLTCIMHEAVRSSRVAMKSGW